MGRTGRTPEEEQRFAYIAGQILEMRRARIKWPVIAQEFNLSETRCHQIYSEALTKYPTQQAEEYRAEELNLADDAVAALLSIALGHHEVRSKLIKGEYVEYEYYPSFKDRIEAWTAIGKWSEHKSKITGIYAPTQIQFSVESVQAEIDRLMLQMSTEESPAIEAGLVD